MSYEKFFIFGCPRSGTTILQQSLNRHPAIVIPPETFFFWNFVGCPRFMQRRQLKRINRHLGITVAQRAHRVVAEHEVRALYEEIIRQYLQRLNKSGVRMVGEKSPRHLLYYPNVLRHYPEAKILLIYRDGRAVASSLCKVPWAPDDLYLNFRAWLRHFEASRKLLADQAVPVYVIRYEEFVAEPERVLRGTTEFLGVDYIPEIATGSGNLEGIHPEEVSWKMRAAEPITMSRAQKWREELAPGQIRLIESWGKDTLAALGYECSIDVTAPLPPWFFPRLYIKLFGWKIASLWKILLRGYPLGSSNHNM